MGRDKALLCHPRGGTWLEATLLLLAETGAPITLMTGHGEHRRIAEHLAPQLAVSLSVIAEPCPHEGPLLALGRLMTHYPDALLLLCPVDMPCLDQACLLQLLRAAVASPTSIHVADDGQRLQPLLGVYPATPGHRHSLTTTLDGGGRSLLRWLQRAGCSRVPLPPASVRNVNHPHELASLTHATSPQLAQA